MTYNINVGPFYIGFPVPVFLPIKVFATMNNVSYMFAGAESFNQDRQFGNVHEEKKQ